MGRFVSQLVFGETAIFRSTNAMNRLSKSQSTVSTSKQSLMDAQATASSFNTQMRLIRVIFRGRRQHGDIRPPSRKISAIRDRSAWNSRLCSQP